MTSLRKFAIGLAIVGAAVAGYLTCVQLKVVHSPWDPIFGAASSDRVLHSRIAEALPFPDALAGAVAYLVEAGLGIVVLRTARPIWRVAYTLAVISLAVVGAGLAALQVVYVHRLCLLCLVSAAVSWVIAGVIAVDEAMRRTTSPDEAAEHRRALPRPPRPVSLMTSDRR